MRQQYSPIKDLYIKKIRMYPYKHSHQAPSIRSYRDDLQENYPGIIFSNLYYVKASSHTCKVNFTCRNKRNNPKNR